MHVLRWGRSAYETDADFALERATAESVGASWRWCAADQRPELGGIDVLVVNSGVKVDADLLDQWTGAGRALITTTSGFDHIDIAAARDRGIVVARCPLARRDAVVETSLAGLYGMFREVPRLQSAARRGHWARGDLPHLGPVLLAERTVAVVGCGVIGRRMCAVLRALGARVLAVDPGGVPEGLPATSLEDALGQADAVTLHCHLRPDTVDLLSADRLDRLRRDAVVINTARGPILDVGAAVARVAAGRLRGLLVDVFPEEPYGALSAGVAVDGVWFLPHAAGFTKNLGERVATEVGQALTALSAGRPLPARVV